MRFLTPLASLIALPILLSLAACIGWGDAVLSERTIVGQYRLKAWEDGSFYLRTPADTGAVTAAAPVERVGWDSAHVLALSQAPGLAPRWTVFDVVTGQSRVLSGAPSADAAVAHIKTLRADSAWARLDRF